MHIYEKHVKIRRKYTNNWICSEHEYDNNTYKGKMSNIYAGQASQIHEKAAFSCISNFPVGFDPLLKAMGGKDPLSQWS